MQGRVFRRPAWLKVRTEALSPSGSWKSPSMVNHAACAAIKPVVMMGPFLIDTAVHPRFTALCTT